MVEIFTIGNKKIACIIDDITLSFPKYGYIDGLTSYSEYIKTGENIPFMDIEYRDIYKVKISFKGDLQIGFGKQGIVNFIKKHYPNIEISTFNRIIVSPQSLTDDEFKNFFNGDKIKIFISLSDKKIFFKLKKKNEKGENMYNDIGRLLEEYNKNKNIGIDKEDLEKAAVSIGISLDKILKEAKEKSELKEAIAKTRKDEFEKLLKEAKKRADTISMEDYVKMSIERFRQGLFLYHENDIKFFFATILSGEWSNLRGVNGIGKDLLLVLFAILSLEDLDKQLLIVTPSFEQETGDSRTLGYQSHLTNKYHYSRIIDFILRSNNNTEKPYIMIITEANIVNMDRAYNPISVAISSAQRKIALPTSRREGEDMNVIKDPEIKNNIIIVNTTNDIARRPEMSLKDIDRMPILSLWDPIIRSTEDRKKLENLDGTNNFKDITLETGPEPIFVELFKKHIIGNKNKFTNLRSLGFTNKEYREFEDKYQDKLRNLVYKLNAILKKGHLKNAQMAPRFTEGALRFLYFAIKELKIEPKLAMSQLILERFIPRIEDATEDHIDTLIKIKNELIEFLSEETGQIKETDEAWKPIEDIDEIIWKLNPRFNPNKK